MTSPLVALLQGALFLLTTLQTNHALTDATRQQMLVAATQAVQLASQSIPTAEPQSADIAPNWTRLNAAEYLDGHGRRVPLGQTLTLLGSYTSFGDLDHDVNDDAVVLVKDVSVAPPTYHLAVMLNDRGSLFNVANLPLPHLKEIYEHRITNGAFLMDYATDDGVRQTVKYKFSGGNLVAF